MQTLTLIRGLPGSGKSTFAHRNLGNNEVHIEADMYFMTDDGEYIFDARWLKSAHNWCFNETEEYLSNGVNVTVSNTFTQQWEMQRYIDLAKAYGVDLNVFTMKTQYENIHNVPEQTINRMKQRWEPYEGEIFVTGE
jgi:predicted kinase